MTIILKCIRQLRKRELHGWCRFTYGPLEEETFSIADAGFTHRPIKEETYSIADAGLAYGTVEEETYFIASAGFAYRVCRRRNLLYYLCKKLLDPIYSLFQ